MQQSEAIAERVIYGVDKDGRGFDIGLKIGRPYETDSPYRAWRCPVSVIGLPAIPDIWGVDSWQALMLAMQAQRSVLEHFVEKGGRLFEEKE